MPESYDILLVGKTGQGRSTLGRKLTNDFKKDSFNECVLMSNEATQIRVLDASGFSSIVTEEQTMVRRNEEIVRSIGSVLRQLQLKIKCVVYFLPGRGPLEKADGAIQEELKILHHYFGKQIFECMVAAATISKKSKINEQIEFDYKGTEKAFHLALKEAINDEDIKYPQVVLIGFNDNPKDTLNMIQNAVPNDVILPRIRDVGPLYPDEPEDEPPPDELQDEPNTSMVVNSQPSSNYIKNIKRFFGTLLHVVLCGLCLVYELISHSRQLPSFFYRSGRVPHGDTKRLLNK